MILPNEQELKQLAEDIYKINDNNGFHDDGLNIHRDILLIITEIGEAVEAHRNKRFIDTKKYRMCLVESDDSQSMTSIELLNYKLGKNEIEDFKFGFERDVRGTFEEEIADTIIRILHFYKRCLIEYSLNECYYFNIPKNNYNDIWINQDLFLLKLIRDISEFGLDKISLIERDLLYFNVQSWLYGLFIFCEHKNIDIMDIIDLKLEYNKLRGYKHGKEY